MADAHFFIFSWAAVWMAKEEGAGSPGEEVTQVRATVG
jgi:hypothetical protein